MATDEYTVSFNSDTSDSEAEMTDTDTDSDDYKEDEERASRLAAARKEVGGDAEEDDADDEFIVHRGAPPPYVEGSYNRYTGLHDIIEIDEDDGEGKGNDERNDVSDESDNEVAEAEFTLGDKKEEEPKSNTTPDASSEFTFTFSADTSEDTSNEVAPSPPAKTELEEDAEFTFSIDFSTEVIEADPEADAFSPSSDLDKEGFEGTTAVSRGSDSGVVSLTDENDTASSLLQLDNTIEESEQECFVILQCDANLDESSRADVAREERYDSSTDTTTQVSLTSQLPEGAAEEPSTPPHSNLSSTDPGHVNEQPCSVDLKVTTPNVTDSEPTGVSDTVSEQDTCPNAGLTSNSIISDTNIAPIPSTEPLTSPHLASDSVQTASLTPNPATITSPSPNQSITEASVEEINPAAWPHDACGGPVTTAEQSVKGVAEAAAGSSEVEMGAGEESKSPEPGVTLSQESLNNETQLRDNSTTEYITDQLPELPQRNIMEHQRTPEVEITDIGDDVSDSFDVGAISDSTKALLAEHGIHIDALVDDEPKVTRSPSPRAPLARSQNVSGLAPDAKGSLDEDDTFEQRISRAKAFIASVDQRISRSDSASALGEVPKTPDTDANLPMFEEDDVFAAQTKASQDLEDQSVTKYDDNVDLDPAQYTTQVSSSSGRDKYELNREDYIEMGINPDLLKRKDLLPPLIPEGAALDVYDQREQDGKSDYSDDYVIGTVMVKTGKGHEVEDGEGSQYDSQVVPVDRGQPKRPRPKYVDRTTELIKKILTEERGEVYTPPSFDDDDDAGVDYVDEYDYDYEDNDGPASVRESALVSKGQYDLGGDSLLERKIEAMRQQNASLQDDDYAYSEYTDDYDNNMALMKNEQALALVKRPRKRFEEEEEEDVFGSASSKANAIMQRYQEDVVTRKPQRAIAYETHNALAVRQRGSGRDDARALVPRQHGDQRDDSRALVSRQHRDQRDDSRALVPRQHRDQRDDSRALVSHQRATARDESRTLIPRQRQTVWDDDDRMLLPYTHIHDNQHHDDGHECTCTGHSMVSHQDSLPDEEFLPQRTEDTEHVVRGKTAEIKTVINKQETVLEQFKHAHDSFEDINNEIKALRQHMVESTERRNKLQEEIQFDLDQAEEAKRNKEFMRKYLPPPEIDYSRGYIPGGLYNKDLTSCKKCDAQSEPPQNEKSYYENVRTKPQPLSITNWRSLGSKPTSVPSPRYPKSATLDVDDLDREDVSSVSSGRSGANRRETGFSYGFKPRPTMDDLETQSDIGLGESAFSVRCAEADNADDFADMDDNGSVSSTGDEHGTLTGIQAWRAKFKIDPPGKTSKSAARPGSGKWRSSETNEPSDSLSNGDNHLKSWKGKSDDVDGDDDVEKEYRSAIRPYTALGSTTNNSSYRSKYGSYSKAYSTEDYGSEIDSNYNPYSATAGRIARSDNKYGRTMSDSDTPRLSRSHSYDPSPTQPFKSRFLTKVRGRRADDDSDVSEKRDKPFKSRFLSNSFSYESNGIQESQEADPGTSQAAPPSAAAADAAAAAAADAGDTD